MKNKIKSIFKKSIVLGAVATIGVGVGYAASTAFQDLDAIRVNFDYILGINQSQESTIGDLNTKIAGLEAEITELEDNQNNSGKQEQIKELKEQVADLETERDGLLADNLELETAINDLRIYTDMSVGGE